MSFVRFFVLTLVSITNFNKIALINKCFLFKLEEYYSSGESPLIRGINQIPFTETLVRLT